MADLSFGLPVFAPSERVEATTGKPVAERSATSPSSPAELPYGEADATGAAPDSSHLSATKAQTYKKLTEQAPSTPRAPSWPSESDEALTQKNQQNGNAREALCFTGATSYRTSNPASS